MLRKTINKFVAYIEFVDTLIDIKCAAEDENIVLYRGQSEFKPLLPSIARDNNSIDSTESEKKMLSELIRRAAFKSNITLNNDWDWLVLAQHFGMKTRLLDWTSNPLIALWFSCSNEYKLDKDSYVFVLIAKEESILNPINEPSPFSTANTKVFKPSLNNERIIAQNGWFTSHKYSIRNKRFVPLENVKELKDMIIAIKISAKIKKETLIKLNTMGINNETLFPDIEGICNQINWDFNKNNLHYNKFMEKQIKLIATKDVKLLNQRNE